MSVQRSQPPPLPSGLVILGSAFVVFHLLAIAVLVLSAPSGPWPTPFGPSQAVGPPFATRVAELTTRYYLQPLKMTHNYHFLGNRPDAPELYFEVRLKDADGRLIDTLHFPSPRANAWLRHRHALLAQSLGDDEPVQPPQGEVIPAPGKKMETMRIWNPVGPNQFALQEVEVQLVPKTGATRPREWSLILARSYMRHLCREHGAASAELTRYSRQAVMPGYLFLEEAPPGTFDALASTFEEYHREK
jgi:hypothetical protein